jgi:hypothetical protein
MNDNHARYPVAENMTTNFTQKSGGFARMAANREGPLRFLDIGSRGSPEGRPQTGGDGVLRITAISLNN